MITKRILIECFMISLNALKAQFCEFVVRFDFGSEGYTATMQSFKEFVGTIVRKLSRRMIDSVDIDVAVVRVRLWLQMVANGVRRIHETSCNFSHDCCNECFGKGSWVCCATTK